MSDYSKINIRCSDFGLNVAHDPITLPFGKYAIFNNLAVDVEGQITSRPGLKQLNPSHAVAGSLNILGVRRLNDSVRSSSTYIARAGTKLYCSTVTATGAPTTTDPFSFTELATLFGSTFGSIAIDRTSLSNQVWAYVGDSARMLKTAINGSGGMDLKAVGIPRPTGPPTMGQSTAGGSLTLLGTYQYRYTLYDNSTGVESLYNSTEGASITLTGTNNTVVVTIPTETVNAAVTHARVYRKGGTLSTWLLLDKVAYTGTTTTYTDNYSDTAIASSTVLDELSNQPYTCTNSSGVDTAGTALPYLFGPVNGYLMACGDPNNTGYLYWSNKFDPDSQDPNNRVEVSSPQDPLMNGFVYDGKAYVFSKEALFYLVLGLGTNTWTPFQTSCGHGLIANSAFCIGPEVYFLSKDGVYATSGGAERCITDDDLRPLFNGKSVVLAGYTYYPVDYAQTSFHRMAVNNNNVWLHYKGTDGNTYTLVYSLVYKRWLSNNFRVGTECLYDDEETTSRLLFGTSNGFLNLLSGYTDEGGSPATVGTRLTTGIITLNAPLMHKEWGPLIFDVDPKGASVGITVFKDKGATSIASATWTDATRSRKILDLNETLCEDICIDVEWASSTVAPILYGFEMLYRRDSIQLDRWSVLNTNHGLDGWQILRSGYITVRSDGTLNLAITVDSGTTYNYTIGTTSSNKQKVFVPFDPIKGKLFTYTLTLGTASFFRLYNDLCEIHVKPWISSMGYTRVNPFTSGEGDAIGSDPAQSQAGPGVNMLPGGGGGGGVSTLGGANPFNSDAFNFLGGGGQVLIPPGESGTINTAGSSGATTYAPSYPSPTREGGPQGFPD